MQVNYIPLSELLDTVVDNRGKTCPTAESGIPLIATNCISNDRLYPANDRVRFVSKNTFDTWFRGHPQPGDFIFVTKGTPGSVCCAPDPVDFCIAQDMVALRSNDKKVYPRYLFAILRSRKVQEQIEQMHVGTLIPHFKKGDFDKLLLPVPDRSVQQLVGDTYFQLSAKIDLNRRMNETLEETVRAIFKWLLLRISARADADHGDGWKDGKFGDVAENIRVQVAPGSLPETTPYIGLDHMPRKSIALIEWGTPEGLASNKFAFKVGDILFGKLRPYFHKVGVAPVDGVCSTDVLVIRPKQAFWFSFVLGHASSPEMVEYADAGSTGTKMPRTSWDELSRFKISVPPDALAQELNTAVVPLIQRLQSNIQESRNLASLRDTLLPGLISGQTTIVRQLHATESAL